MSGQAYRAMPAPLALAVFLVAIVGITGTLSAPMLQMLHAAGVSGATLEGVAVRTLELTGIALTFILLAVLGTGGRHAWGVPPRRRLPARLAAGLGLGILSLLPVCVILFALDVRVTRVDLVPTATWWLSVIARASLSAVVVAVMEEFWFRGGLFTALERSGGAMLALWLGGAIYAAAHFLEVPDGHVPPDGMLAGFAVLGEAAASIFQMRNLDSFAALLMAGLALGLLRLRQGDVAVCIGIHAGWVLTIKVFKKYTYIEPDSPFRAAAGHYDDFIGWTAALSLGLLLLAVWRFVPPRGEEAR